MGFLVTGQLTNKPVIVRPGLESLCAIGKFDCLMLIT